MTLFYIIMGLCGSLWAAAMVAAYRGRKIDRLTARAESAEKAATALEKEREVTHDANEMDFDSILDANDRLRDRK